MIKKGQNIWFMNPEDGSIQKGKVVEIHAGNNNILRVDGGSRWIYEHWCRPRTKSGLASLKKACVETMPQLVGQFQREGRELEQKAGRFFRAWKKLQEEKAA